MKTRKTLFALAFVVASMFTLPAARADEVDEASKITFSQAVQIPGQVLPAGTYWFVMGDINSNTNLVQIFSADHSIVYASILMIATERPRPSEKAAITFADRGPMEPEAIVSFFYHGRHSGHQFVYPKPEEQELARAKRQTITAG
jgi:hypothetical protein